MPRLWKKLVVAIWNPTRGKARFIILNPLLANDLSSGSLVNSDIAISEQSSETRKPKHVTDVVQITVSLNTRLTLLYFLAPKL